jgi:hypothetical protein
LSSPRKEKRPTKVRVTFITYYKEECAIFTQLSGIVEMQLSSSLLQAILPERIIKAMLESSERTPIVESFPGLFQLMKKCNINGLTKFLVVITVLHLDVTSFTVLSGSVKPDVLISTLVSSLESLGCTGRELMVPDNLPEYCLHGI